jgi:hypothetical protein
MHYHVKVTSEGVVFQTMAARDPKHIGTYTSVADWKNRRPPDAFSVVFSSSIDWPEDQTKDLDIIELADRLRGNNVSGRNPDFETL